MAKDYDLPLDSVLKIMEIEQTKLLTQLHIEDRDIWDEQIYAIGSLLDQLKPEEKT